MSKLLDASSASFFFEVSICSARRSGRTAKRFLGIFSPNDILSVVKGVGNKVDESIANSISVSSNILSNLEDTLTNLNPINLGTIEATAGDFKIAYRPTNPLIERSNKSNNMYTQFVLYKSADELTKIDILNI